MMKHSLFVSLLAATISVGCDEKPTATVDTKDATAKTAAAPVALPGNLLLAAAPVDAREISAFKTDVKDGHHVVIRGVIAGREDPLAENRAIVTLLDRSVNTCDKNPGDGCKTPWDACCEPADVLAKHSVTVQVVDADGRPLKISLASIDGVKPLAHLIVSGTATVSADGVVLVNADGIHIVQ